MLIRADARSLPLADESVNCCVTSPPYWGLRDYGVVGQIGLEPTPELYVATMVDVFREVRRVLKADGTLWLNLGDSYAASGPAGGAGKQHTNAGSTNVPIRKAPSGLKPKDLVGIPWRVAFALQSDGWWLRSDIIWAKPNPMPESVTDRPTKSHEYLFLLAKAERYYYDAASISEKAVCAGDTRSLRADNTQAECEKPKQDLAGGRTYEGFNSRYFTGKPQAETRNARSVWTIPTTPYPGAHFATFPPELARRCILAGCPPGGIVLDPFVGSGTTVKVARELGREGIGVDINEKYLTEQASQRIKTNRGFVFRSQGDSHAETI